MTINLSRAAKSYLTRPEIKVGRGARTLATRFIRYRYRKALELFPGLDIQYVSTGEPYPTAGDMSNDVYVNHRMKVSNLYNTSTVFHPDDNLLLRAGHDLLDHVYIQNGFSVADELTAYNNMRADWDVFIAQHKSVPYCVRDAVMNALFCEFALQPIAADWLGGYDSIRDGLGFSQRVIDARDILAGLD